MCQVTACFLSEFTSPSRLDKAWNCSSIISISHLSFPRASVQTRFVHHFHSGLLMGSPGLKSRRGISSQQNSKGEIQITYQSSETQPRAVSITWGRGRFRETCGVAGDAWYSGRLCAAEGPGRHRQHSKQKQNKMKQKRHPETQGLVLRSLWVSLPAPYQKLGIPLRDAPQFASSVPLLPVGTATLLEAKGQSDSLLESRWGRADLGHQSPNDQAKPYSHGTHKT